MKIAISSDGNTIEGNIDQRFGRCKYFLIVEINDDRIVKTEAIENEGAIQGHGAGIKAAQQIANLGVKAVITGSLGPNATEILKKLDVKSYHSSGNVNAAVELCMKNELDEIKEVAQAHSNETVNESTESTESTAETERIFFPLIDDKGMDSEISSHFGHAPFFGVYNVADKDLKIIKNDLNHTDPNKSPIDQIEQAVNPTTIFAKGIGARAIGIISQKGLSLKTGNYNNVKDAIENLDKLEDQTEGCGHEDH